MRPCWLIEVRHAPQNADPVLEFVGRGIDQALAAGDEEAMYSWLDTANDVAETRELAARTAALN